MPVICFAQVKGGCGKSTAATILATELASEGAEVALIDADPNKPLVRWSRMPNRPERVRVIGDVAEDTLIETIETESERVPFVLVDLEGTRSRMTSFAMSRSDLVLLPCQGSDLDAVQAMAGVREVRSQEKAFRQRIPYATLFTRTSAAIQPRTLKAIEADFRANEVPILNVRLHERDAFKAVHSFGGGLRTLDPKEVRNIPAAIANARAFMQEVLKILKANQAEAT